MVYYNPFTTQSNQQTTPSTQIDPNQFKQFAVTLNDKALAQLVQLAQQKGISEADIQSGINFIKSL